VFRELEERLDRALERAAARGDVYLAEDEGLAVAAALGLTVPLRAVIDGPEAGGTLDLEPFGGDRLVVKVLSPEIAHKSDAGGVAICEREPTAIEVTVRRMAERFSGHPVDGFSIHEFIEHDRAPGSELLLGVRWSDEFGPVAVVGLGGLEVERLAAGGGWGEPILANRTAGEAGAQLPDDADLMRFLTEPYRGQASRIGLDRLEAIIADLLAFGEHWMDPARQRRISDFEVNPAVLRDGDLIALDALVRPAGEAPAVAPARPIDKLRRLLEPRSIAIAGVSRRMNVGRIILKNILRQGFDPARVRVIKPGADEVDGCRSFDAVDQLPERVDLAILAVSASQLPELVDEIVHQRRAESMILIPGGLGELEGSEAYASSIAQSLSDARASDWRGPVANGGNCLGVRSLPGSYDTLFIPGHKLRFPSGPAAPLALLSQSGAFAVARASKLSGLNPKYVVTFGNQIDLTLGDYLHFLKDDRKIAVFACYVEGFRALDGQRFLEASREIVASGRTVVLYRAGRTRAGASAAASHTASVAGSYTVTRQLARRAGIQVAESIEEFEDLVRIFSLLEGRPLAGRRLGAVSNAGFESVAMGDNLGNLALANLGDESRRSLDGVLREHQLETIVAVRNPLDLTPIVGDEGFAAATRVVLEDPAVDLGIVGCVPLTGALQTVAAAADHDENVAAPSAVAQRLVELWNESTKPWVVAIDYGELFDLLARILYTAGIPTFRSADRALAALNCWAAARLAASE
jgi:acyl-CoA synthetase (NDP forming)